MPETTTPKRIAIIGGGWYGCHLALSLAKRYPCPPNQIVLYEKNSVLMNEVSGKYGIRLHRGHHYQRSKKTRESCQRGFDAFQETYPELIQELDYSIYGLAYRDSDDNPPKVDKEHFLQVAKETPDAEQIKLEDYGLKNLQVALNVHEPCVAVGEQLRNYFVQKLQGAHIDVVYSYPVNKITPVNHQFEVSGNDYSETFDHVINATNFQSLLNQKINCPLLPLDIQFRYQSCLALIYEDTTHSTPTKPFSLIAMDGWLPSFMPHKDASKINETPKYLLTHGKWTILGSYKTAGEAKFALGKVNSTMVEKKVKPRCEKSIARFFPKFSERFGYVGYQQAVTVKMKTQKEFRSALTFTREGIICVLPGKISNIFDVEKEVLQLINGDNLIEDGIFTYTSGGILDTCQDELTELPDDTRRNTTCLQTMEKEYNGTPSFWEKTNTIPKLCPGQVEEKKLTSHGTRKN